MQPTVLGNLLNVSGQTIRRWCTEYAACLSPGASPRPGQPRILNDHDRRVMMLVSELRVTGLNRRQIMIRLEAERDNGYEGLPALPSEWNNLEHSGQTVSLSLAAARIAQERSLAMLQSEVQHLTHALDVAEDRVAELKARVAELEEAKGTTEEQLHAAQLELAAARGEAETLRASLQAYTLGRDRPVNVGLLVLSALLIGAALVAAVFVLARLVV
jgi:DNA-binding transcriptional MerR regulator